MEGFELSVFFAFVDVLSQAIGYVETCQASFVTRPERLHESWRQFVMRIECEDCPCQYLAYIFAAHRFGLALDVSCICLEVHVLQRIAAMQLVVLQDNRVLKDVSPRLIAWCWAAFINLPPLWCRCWSVVISKYVMIQICRKTN